MKRLALLFVIFASQAAAQGANNPPTQLPYLTIAPGQLSIVPSNNTTGGAIGPSVGLDIIQTLSGTIGSYSANLIDVLSDVSNIGGGFLNTFTVNERYGGPTAQGGRQSILGNLLMLGATSASNTNRNYVGVEGAATSAFNDNGTNTGAGALGALFGSASFGHLLSGATNWLEVTGDEIDVAADAGSSMKLKFGLSVVELATDAVHAGTSEGLLALGASPGAVGMNNGILFTNQNGQFPVISTGTGINFETGSLANVIDVSNLTISTDILKASTAVITGLGGFYASGTDAFGFVSTGTHSSAGFDDSSTSPYGIVLNGTYSQGGLYTTGPILQAQGVPTISACGTSPPVATAGSSDGAGQFTTGTASPTACTVTFATAYPNTAFCSVTPEGTLQPTSWRVSAQSKSAFTVTFAPGTSSQIFNYTCGGN